ncbi:hypothetical protein DCC81_24755 [Chitinophaga parva]|uniref:Uncharacterized protein n=1 Tax=Chitinophaga parva TaxID=2169414 RepID=A0A2T7BBP3_9BACT|nr:hypothetical protein [Chitinophaga parva]PUZ21801.1 hypothetical protein DCC81_24755 [Chitinophaga parva]
MQVTVINQFTCRITGENFTPGRVVDLSPFRAGELYAKGKIQVSPEVVALASALSGAAPSYVDGGIVCGEKQLAEQSQEQNTALDEGEKKDPAPAKEKAEVNKAPGKKEK